MSVVLYYGTMKLTKEASTRLALLRIERRSVMFSLIFDILIKWPLMFLFGPIGLLF